MGKNDNKVTKNLDLSPDAIKQLTIMAAENSMLFKPFAEMKLEEIAAKHKEKSKKK